MLRPSTLASRDRANTTIVLLALMLPFVLVALITGLDHPFDFDEGDYHVPVVLEFAESLPRPDLINYDSATTPLMHLVLAVWGRLVGTEPWKLRLIVLLAGMLSVVVFYLIVRERDDPKPFLLTLYFIAYPYAFWLSFLVMTEVFALLFGILALRYLLRHESTRLDLFLFALFASLAVLTRQQWLFLPLGVGLYWLWRDRSLRRAVWAAVPVLCFLPFFLVWGGMAPPQNWATSHALTVNLVQLAHVLLAVGFYFSVAPLTAPVPWRRVAPFALLLVPIFLVSPQIEAIPESWSLVSSQRIFAGSIARMSDLAASFLPVPIIYAGYFVLIALGLLILAQAWLRREDDNAVILWFLIIPFVLSLLLVGQAWERYLLPLIPLLLLTLYAHQRPRRRFVYYWLPVQLILLAGFMWIQLNQ